MSVNLYTSCSSFLVISGFIIESIFTKGPEIKLHIKLIFEFIISLFSNSNSANGNPLLFIRIIHFFIFSEKSLALK